MFTSFKGRFLLSAAAAGLSFFLFGGQAVGQQYINLHLFAGEPTDGNNPQSDLALSGNLLYGTTSLGGSWDSGSIFAVSTDGTFSTNLYSFSQPSTSGFTNEDGAYPQSGLVVAGNTLYGNAPAGGTGGLGTIYRINTDGSSFTTLHNFSGADGNGPDGDLLLFGATLYGTTSDGGSLGYGTIFALNTNGTGFTTLYSFTNGLDGATPQAGLILSGSTLYGTAFNGGASSNGTIFAISATGAGFHTIYAFSPLDAATETTNSDGANPQAALVLSNGKLFGTTFDGGPSGDGVVFAVNASGSGFTVLHAFSADASESPNADGADPEAGLVLAGNTLYGTTAFGGAVGYGNVFSVGTSGGNFNDLFDFTGGMKLAGGLPAAGLTISNGVVYGTAIEGGLGDGVVFSLTLNLTPAPQLAIRGDGPNIVLSWPSSVTGWELQTNNQAGGTGWQNYGGPIVNNTVTNSATTGRVFYRLRQIP